MNINWYINLGICVTGLLTLDQPLGQVLLAVSFCYTVGLIGHAVLGNPKP